MRIHLQTDTANVARLALLLTLGLLLCGCVTPKEAEEQEKPKAYPPKLVGRIASIPPDRKFVLIQSYGSWDVSVGSILTTRGEQNRTANLLFTGEKLGQFAAADIQSGSAERGDAVYSQHFPKPSSESLSSPAESPTIYEDPSEVIVDPPLPE